MNANRAWFKSSYSGAEGGQCLEAALEWRKSSYSGAEGGESLEVARASAIHVRDSKNADPNSGPTLAISADSWTTFVKFAAGSALQ
ncbi:DUF397 domain-containing protein [Streptomyces sp. NPDC059897]|uniref:DUF397 domain-containing protein n=1 Tax=Streptomyces sp. NPDC059897 TaxID=3346994 RepID=UPI003654DECE